MTFGKKNVMNLAIEWDDGNAKMDRLFVIHKPVQNKPKVVIMLITIVMGEWMKSSIY